MSSGRRASARADWSREAAAHRGEPRCAGVHHLLRVPRPRHPVPRGGAVVARGVRGERSRRRGGPGGRARPRSRTPTPRICCYSMTCWASPTRRWRCPTIAPDARRRRLTALVNAVVAGPRRRRRCMSSRTCTGSTRSANRCWPISCGDPADPVAGADHLPPRIPRRAEPGVGRADHRAAPADRCGNRGADRRAAGLGCLDRAGWPR